MHYSVAFHSLPKVASVALPDIVMSKVVLDNEVKYVDPGLNRSRVIQLSDGILDGF